MITIEMSAVSSETELLRFGRLTLQRIKGEAYLLATVENSCRFGSQALSAYFPLIFSGILELALLPNNKIIHPADILFLDIETTALSRGAGNFPFLTGLAFFRGESIVFEQIFLNEISAEEPFLDYLTSKTKQFPYLVSYNGKSFDIPIIKNRLILNRKKFAAPVIHFDLLHILRRLFPRGTVRRYRQKDMERILLGNDRKEDINGADIPQIYFDYKKYGIITQMESIFLHNRFDLLGMVFLFLEAQRIYREKDQSISGVRSGLARILTKNKRTGEAIEILEDTDNKKINNGDSRRRHLDALFLAALYHRRGEWEKAIKQYYYCVENFLCIDSSLALAKIMEHRKKDFREALKHTLFLIKKENATLKRSENNPFSLKMLEKRKKRLEKKSGLIANIEQQATDFIQSTQELKG